MAYPVETGSASAAAGGAVACPKTAVDDMHVTQEGIQMHETRLRKRTVE